MTKMNRSRTKTKAFQNINTKMKIPKNIRRKNVFLVKNCFESKSVNPSSNCIVYLLLSHFGGGQGRSDEAAGVDGGIVRNMGGEPSLRRDVCILAALSLHLFLASSISSPFPFFLQFHGTSIYFVFFFFSLYCIANVQCEKEHLEYVFIWSELNPPSLYV